MPLTIHPDAPPLRTDAAGAGRVGKTRVLFVLVVREFQNGATPEEIVSAYDTLDLADAYAAVAYYLRHKAEVEEYLAEYDREGEAIRKKVEARQGDTNGIRARLLARKAAMEANGRAVATETSQPGLTHDHRTMPGYTDDRIVAGEPMPGLFVLSGLTVRRAIDELVLAVECSTHEEWVGQVQRFPL